jgi:hypothetical protein
MAYDLIPYNSSDFMSYPSGRGMIFLYNLSRGSFWNLLGGLYLLGVYLLGVYLLGVYIRRPSLPTVHFDGPPGFVFFAFIVFSPSLSPLWIMNSERLYY